MKKVLAIALLFLLSIPSGVRANDDILTTAARNGSFNTLVSLCVAADLDEVLQGKGDFTVFAPTDEAFAKLPAETLQSLSQPENRDQLIAILKYHVLPTRVSVPAKAPSHPLRSAKSLLGPKINFQRKGNRLEVNGNEVVTRNIRCTNGIIQVIDGVLLPPEDKSIVGTAKKAGTFKTLLAALDAAELTDALSGKGPFTVFAPTDKAFAAIPKSTLKSLLKPENKDKLAKILKYHVVAGKVDAKGAIQAGKAKTLAGNQVNIELKAGQLRINKSKVLNNDIETSNGIIHVIDQVLIPDSNTEHSSTSKENTITITSSWNNSVKRDGIKADRLIIRCAGGSIRLTDVQARKIETAVSGGGSVAISGNADLHTAFVSGGGRLNTRSLKTAKTDIRVNGGGTADVFATDKLVAKANGGATLRYVDTDAKIEKTINRYARFERFSNSNDHVSTTRNRKAH